MQPRDSRQKPCPDADGHERHICRLLERGETAEVDRLTATANFICKACGVYAESADCLCRPEPL